MKRSEVGTGKLWPLKRGGRCIVEVAVEWRFHCTHLGLILKKNLLAIVALSVSIRSD